MMVPSPSAASMSRNGRHYQAAQRLLHIDPTGALRALDPVSPEPKGSPRRSAYEEALSLRIIANSLLGLHDAALRTARELAAYGQGQQSRQAVTTWLLTYAGDARSLATPLVNGGCGRARCAHDPVTELALSAIREAGDPDQRRETASTFARIRPDEASFKLAGAHALREAGRIDDAVSYLTSLHDPSMRHAAGVLLYDAGRFAEALPLLTGREELHAAATLATHLASSAMSDASTISDPSVSSSLSKWQALRAIHLEATGHWAEASLAWTEAQRPMEAWEAALMGGSIKAPIDGAERRLAWRYFALTGEQRPSRAPKTKTEHRYAAIGRAMDLIGQVRAGRRPRMTEAEEDPFQIEGLLTIVAKGYSEPIIAASRLISLDPPDRPRDLLPRLVADPVRSDWLTSTARRLAWSAWVEAHPAAPIPGPKVAQYALLSKSLRGDDTRGSQQLSTLLDGLPKPEVVCAIGVALAKGWEIPTDLALTLLEPATIAACLEHSRADLLPAMALLASVEGYPEERRRIAAEICGSLVALAQARGEVSAEGGRHAVSVVKSAIAEIPPTDDVLGPVVAYELELSWVDERPSILAGPILAGRAGLDAKSANVPRGSRTRFYGALGRALILKEAGNLKAALDLARALQATPDVQTAKIISEIQVALAERLAQVGKLDEAVSVVIAAQPDGAGAAATVARRIVDQHEGSDFAAPIGTLKSLYEAYPDEPAVAVAYADLLNRRAVVRMNNDGALNSIMPDLKLALRLDPDDMSIRSNLAFTYFRRAMDGFQNDPRLALRDLREACSIDPNNAQLREVGADVAMACGARFIERQQLEPAKEAVYLALELDPSNEHARRIRPMLMFR